MNCPRRWYFFLCLTIVKYLLVFNLLHCYGKYCFHTSYRSVLIPYMPYLEYMEGDSQICFSKDGIDLLRIRIKSSHVSSKKYFVWMKYSESEVNSCRCRWTCCKYMCPYILDWDVFPKHALCRLFFTIILKTLGCQT